MILDRIVADKKKRLIEHKRLVSEEEIKSAALKSKRESLNFYNALAKEGLSIIGEFKRASPSLGVISNQLSLTDRMGQYNASVDAVSCLTEEDHFYGSIEYLKQVRKMSSLPILRKDFMIDPYQVYEAKVIGADAILLIAAILTEAQIKEYYSLAESLGLFSLVEVHNEAEMEQALKIGAKIIGINNRDLKEFTIHLDTTKRLSKMVDKEVVLVSESGVTKTEDIIFLKECSVDALLIGRAFMEAGNPEELAREWKKVYQE